MGGHRGTRHEGGCRAGACSRLHFVMWFILFCSPLINKDTLAEKGRKKSGAPVKKKASTCLRPPRRWQTSPPARLLAPPLAQSRSRRAYSAIGATSLPRRHLAMGRRTRAAQCGPTERLRRGPALPMAATGAAPPPACCLCLSQPCDPSANAHLERDVRSRCDWQHSRR